MAVRKIGNIDINYTVPEAQTQMWNALGRTEGAQQANNDNRNFFQKRWDSIKNFGQSSLGALYESGLDLLSPIRSRITGEEYYSHQAQKQNDKTNQLMADNQTRMNDIVKGYGYNSLDDYYNALDDAEVNDKAKYNELLNTVQEDLKNQSNANMEAMRKNQADYKDYVQNNFASKNLQQDRGKYLGAGINTFSTAADLTGLSATPLANAIQGGVEGIADELEQNGFENFDWNRAGQNAAIGATTGAVTGALNKGLSNSLAKKGGNLFKGGNKLTNWLNETGSKTALGRAGSTIATGAGRGAVSGAVGGATGAGMSALFNGGDVIGSALQGAVSGAQQGALAGGTMAGANMAISKTPGVGKFYNDLQNAKANWDKSGSNFDERLTNTINSGESGIGNWLNGKTNSKLLNRAGNLGNTVRFGDINYNEDDQYWSDIEELKAFEGLPGNDRKIREIARKYDMDIATVAQDIDDFNSLTTANSPSTKYVGVDTLGNRTEYTPAEFQRLLQEYDNTYSPKDHSVLLSDGSTSEVDDVVGRAGGELMKIYKTMNGGVEVNPYNRESWEQFDNWVADQRTNLKNQNPTTAKGWLKKAGERIVEDANNRGVGLGIKNVADEMPKDVRNLKIVDNNNIDTTSDVEIPKDVMQRLDYLRNEIDNERISYGELAELQDYKPQILKLGDTQLAEWAGIPEEEFMAYQDNAAPVAKTTRTRTPNAQVDGWDRVAQEAGYNSYNDAIRAYMEANPDTPLNPRGAAGQILTWLDENPNTPTTAKGWAKKAGQRIVEEANNRGVGLGIKDVSQETPETEIYRKLTNQVANDTQNKQVIPELQYGESELGNRTKRGMLADGLERFGNTLEGAQSNVTRAAMKDIGVESTGKVIENVRKKTGITNLETQARIARELTGGADSLLDNVQRDALTASVDGKPYSVDTTGLLKDVDSIVNKYADTNIFGSMNARNKFIQNLKTDISSYDSDVLSIANRMKATAADYRGKGVGEVPAKDKALAKIYTEVGNRLEDLSYQAIPKYNVNQMFDTAISEMRGRSVVAKNNGNNDIAVAYDQLANNLEQTPRTIKNYRSFKKDFVDVSKIADLTARAENGAAMQMGRGFGTGIKRFTGALLQRPVNTALAKIGGGVNRLADKIGNNDTVTPSNNTIAIGSDYNPATQIYNAIGRTEGLQNAENARSADYLAQAAQEAEIVPNTGSLENLVAPTASAQTSVYNSVYGTPTTVSSINNTQQGGTNTGYFQPTGDYWTDIIASAMSSAIDKNDVNAFAALYGMYQDSLANLQKQSSSSASEQKLTATQQRANAAMNSLERLSGMTPDLGYNLSNIPVIGNIATFGGNDYESEAKSLAQQIGYMVSGSNIKDNEAEAIGKAYVPQPWDSEATRQNKLRRAYEIISQYQNGYAEV